MIKETQRAAWYIRVKVFSSSYARGDLLCCPANTVTQRVVIITTKSSVCLLGATSKSSLRYRFSTSKFMASSPANEVLTLHWFFYGLLLLVIDGNMWRGGCGCSWELVNRTVKPVLMEKKTSLLTKKIWWWWGFSCPSVKQQYVTILSWNKSF